MSASTGNILPPTFPALSSGALFNERFTAPITSKSDYVSFGHLFQRGQLATGQSLASAAPTQIDALTRYSDGSMCLAQVTTQIPAQTAASVFFNEFSPVTATATPIDLATAIGSHTLTVDITPTSGAANQRLTAPISVDLMAALKATTSPVLTRSGPLVTTAYVNVDRIDGATGIMRAYAWVSFYADGSMGARVVVAADITDIEIAPSDYPPRNSDVCAYSATITADGVASTYSDIVQWFSGKWDALVGYQPVIAAYGNPVDLLAADCTRPYNLALGVLPATVADYQNVPAYAPMQDTIVTEYMPTVGGRNDIGEDFLADVVALMTGDAGAISAMLGAARVSGSIPWNYYNPATGAYWSPYDATPNNLPLWTDPVDASGNCIPINAASSPWMTDPAHMPDLTYLPLLMTGDPYYADLLAAQMSFSLVGEWPYQRGKTLDIVVNGGQVRGDAWQFRTLLYAAYVLEILSKDGVYKNFIRLI
ncbi:hypothetical protein, partial [Acidiphilium sp.]|uniref:hypothetical protein n=1 Tax=Acidiphilium sp. TaxID=527 RepID=UPI003D019D47